MRANGLYRVPCYRCDGRGYHEYDGARLRRARLAAGLSLREVARRLKLSAPYICDVELNRRACSTRIRAFYEGL